MSGQAEEIMSDDERTVKAWRDIVHAQLSTTQEGRIVHVPDPRPVSITRTALVALLDIAERAIAKPTDWQAAASRLWTVEEHVNPFELLDAQLDMLERMWDVENGAANVEIWRDGSEWPWHVTCVLHGDEWDDDDPQGPVVAETRRTTYSGDTLADAVAHAWRRHRGPVICPACDGEGTRLATDVEIAAGGPRMHTRSTSDADGNRGEEQRVSCDVCFDELGYVLTLPKPGEAAT